MNDLDFIKQEVQKEIESCILNTNDYLSQLLNLLLLI